MSTAIEFSKVILLAEDDADDCLLFEEALREVSEKSRLTTVKDGGHLMEHLDQTVPPAPDVIFLDLNMPNKNGFECLDEIKDTPKLKNIPIVIFSTSSNPETIDRVYKMGANFYMSKPGTFFLLKKAILHVLNMDLTSAQVQPPKENFILQLN
jgi:CheY-like chemotaxis protein